MKKIRGVCYDIRTRVLPPDPETIMRGFVVCFFVFFCCSFVFILLLFFVGGGGVCVSVGGSCCGGFVGYLICCLFCFSFVLWIFWVVFLLGFGGWGRAIVICKVCIGRINSIFVLMASRFS